jgi:hypothetical protein
LFDEKKTGDEKSRDTVPLKSCWKWTTNLSWSLTFSAILSFGSSNVTTCSPSLIVRADVIILAGDVTVVSNSSFKAVFDLIFLVLAVHPDATKIILPRPPRYLFTGCCANTSHA